MLTRPTTTELVDIPENPAPRGAFATRITTRDGVALRVARFAPLGATCKGTVCLFQGRAEFIEKYFETVEDLRSRGFAVATLDWRGQGLSQRRRGYGRRGHVARFDRFQADMEAFMGSFVWLECPPPYFALAHSMGGAILLETVRRRPLWFERLVLSAPMVGLPGRAGGAGARRLAALLAAFGLGRLFVPGGGGRIEQTASFKGNPLTGDERRYRRAVAVARANPALCIGSPTIGWLRAAYRAMALAEDRARIETIRTPTLIVAAALDEIVSNRAIEALARRMMTARVIVLDGARHELLMERDGVREAFFAAFDAFVPGTDPFPGSGSIDPL